MLYESVQYPDRVLKERIEAFKLLWRTFEASISGMQESVRVLKTSLESLNRTILSSLEHGAWVSREYLTNSNISKLDVATELTSPNIFDGINNLKVRK